MSEQGKLLSTNTQLGQKQTEQSLIWVHIWDLRLGGFGIVNTYTVHLTITTIQMVLNNSASIIIPAQEEVMFMV